LLIDRAAYAASFSIVTQKYIVVCESRSHCRQKHGTVHSTRVIIVVTRNLYNAGPNETQ